MKKSIIKGDGNTKKKISMKEMYKAGLFDKKTTPKKISDNLKDFNLSDLKSFSHAEGILGYYKLNKVHLIKASNSLG